MEKKSWMMVESSKSGDSWPESYETKEEAVAAAEKDWDSLTKLEKKDRTVIVFQTDYFDEDGEALIPTDGYYTVWENGEAVK